MRHRSCSVAVVRASPEALASVHHLDDPDAKIIDLVELPGACTGPEASFEAHDFGVCRAQLSAVALSRTYDTFWLWL